MIDDERVRCAEPGPVPGDVDLESHAGLVFRRRPAPRGAICGQARSGHGSRRADIVDIGGESTRPGADRTPEAAELARVLPVVSELAGAGTPISIDTMRSRVAAAAIDAGASIVNDVSGGLADPAMAGVVAQTGVAFVAMHWRAHSRAMGAHARYGNVVDDVVTELRVRVDALLSAGIAADRIVLDPGLGFAKTAEHNWELLSRLDRLTALGIRRWSAPPESRSSGQ